MLVVLHLVSAVSSAKLAFCTIPCVLGASLAFYWTLASIPVLTAVLANSPTQNSASFIFLQFESYSGWIRGGFVVLLGFL